MMVDAARAIERMKIMMFVKGNIKFYSFLGAWRRKKDRDHWRLLFFLD
jgi:hypothetical protein